jgi:hypothetical protein
MSAKQRAHMPFRRGNAKRIWVCGARSTRMKCERKISSGETEEGRSRQKHPRLTIYLSAAACGVAQIPQLGRNRNIKSVTTYRKKRFRSVLSPRPQDAAKANEKRSANFEGDRQWPCFSLTHLGSTADMEPRALFISMAFSLLTRDAAAGIAAFRPDLHWQHKFLRREPSRAFLRASLGSSRSWTEKSSDTSTLCDCAAPAESVTSNFKMGSESRLLCSAAAEGGVAGSASVAEERNGAASSVCARRQSRIQRAIRASASAAIHSSTI